MQRCENSATQRKCAALLLLITGADLALAAQPACTPTPLSQQEAEQLAVLTSTALAAKSMGGKLTAIYFQPPDSDDTYNFMVRSTISPPGAPIDNGLVGYYAVSKATGRVLNVALREEKGEELLALQKELRSKHCVSPAAIKAEHDADNYEHDDE